jgi:hypothetical protein
LRVIFVQQSLFVYLFYSIVYVCSSESICVFVLFNCVYLRVIFVQLLSICLFNFFNYGFGSSTYLCFFVKFCFG